MIRQNAIVKKKLVDDIAKFLGLPLHGSINGRTQDWRVDIDWVAFHKEVLQVGILQSKIPIVSILTENHSIQATSSVLIDPIRPQMDSQLLESIHGQIHTQLLPTERCAY